MIQKKLQDYRDFEYDDIGLYGFDANCLPCRKDDDSKIGCYFLFVDETWKLWCNLMTHKAMEILKKERGAEYLQYLILRGTRECL